MHEGTQRISDLQLNKEMRFCTACQKTKPVTDEGRWIRNRVTRWQCEWCNAKRVAVKAAK